MAKYSKRAAAALKTVLPSLAALDNLPPLKSLALTIFFDNKGDQTHVTPRFDVVTDQSHLTAATGPSGDQ